MASQLAAGGVVLSVGDILISDVSNFGPGNAIVHINPTTGVQSLIATGGYLVNPTGLVIDQAGSLIVADIDAIDGNGALIRVDPLTGAQTVISSGGYFNDPWGVALDNTGNIYVTDRIALGGPGSVIRVDPVTGLQTQVLAGGNFVKPTGIAIDDDGHILVADRNAFPGQGNSGSNSAGAIISVDPVSGAQTVIASNEHFRNPFDVEVHSDGDAIVADADADGFQGAVIEVDRVHGTQSLLSSRGMFVDPHGLAIENNGDILVAGIFDLGTAGAGPYSGGVMRIDPQTGVQTLVSANGYLTNHFGPAGIAVVRPPIGWDIDANGNWSAASNWTGGVPNSTSARAVFGPLITASRVVTVNTPITVARIDFDNGKSYTIGGFTPLTLESTTGNAEINVLSGSHTISAPLILADDTAVTVAPASSNLSIVSLAAAGLNLTKSGAGTLTTNNIRAAALTVNDGTVALADQPVSGTSVFGALTIAGGAAPAATFDVSSNAVVIDYTGTTAVSLVRQQILAGRGGSGLGQTWNGRGITSSAAAAAEPETRSIGYVENADLPLGEYTNFRGQPVDDTSILMAFTRTGDANLDGVVDDADVTIVGATYAPGVPQPHWALGDFDYNGFVDDADVTLLSALYDPTAEPLITPAPPGAAAVAAVPEPGSLVLAMLGISVFAILIKRRRVRTAC